MGKGESVDKVRKNTGSKIFSWSFQVDGKRRSFSSTVNILTSNETDQVLIARKEWVKGGEAFERPTDILPGEIDIKVALKHVVAGDVEAFLVVRNSSGNHGTLAYSLGTSKLTLVVMWTSGMNADHYANIVGIGVSSNQNTDKFKYVNIF